MTKYTWTAYYNDGTKLSQFNENGEENLFGAIDESKLVNFVLSQNHQEHIQIDDFVVSLLSGVICIHGVLISFGEFDTNRLIYFRRNKATIGSNGTVQSISHILGLQATVNGHNRKVMFGINDETKEVSLIYD